MFAANAEPPWSSDYEGKLRPSVANFNTTLLSDSFDTGTGSSN